MIAKILDTPGAQTELRWVQSRPAFTSAPFSAGIVATLFALAVIFTPWESFGPGEFVDFNVYLQTFQPGNPSVIETHQPSTLVEFYSREVVWDEFVRFLVLLLGSPFFALKLISASVLWINSYTLYRRYGFLLPTILLLNPLFLTYSLSQLRIAFAVSLLLLVLSMRSRAVRLSLVVAALFIHSAVPIFLSLYLVVKYVERHGQEWPLHRFMALVGSVCVALIFLLVFGRDSLLLAIGDRRAFLYSDPERSSSILYTSFWIGMAAMQVVAGRDYLRRPDNLYSLLILTLYAGLTLLNTYGSRFLAAAFPVVMASAMNLPPENRNIVLPTLMVFQLLQLFYWFGFRIT